VSGRGRLTDEQAAAVLANAVPLDRPSGASSLVVRPFTAQRLSGEEIVITPSRSHRQLLLFLSESCEGCRDLFDASGAPEAFGLRGPDELFVLLAEHPRGAQSITGAPRDSWLVSTEAFTCFQVTSAPFFVLFDPRFATVATEGVAWGTASVRSSVERTATGSPEVETVRLDAPPT
jgi:hypothetical protein